MTTPNYVIIKKTSDLLSHPSPMNAKKNTHKKVGKLKKTSKKIPRKQKKVFTKIFAPKLPQWFQRLFHRWKVPFTESEPTNCQRYPKIPEDSHYRRNGGRLLPIENSTQTGQYWSSRFCNGKKWQKFHPIVPQFYVRELSTHTHGLFIKYLPFMA